MGGKSGGHKRTNSSTNAVTAMHATERGCCVGQVGAEDIVQSESNGVPKTCREEGNDNNRERRCADNDDVGDEDKDEGEDEGLGASQASFESVCERGSADETEGVGKKNEGDSTIPDVVVFFEVWEQGTECGVVETLAKVDKAGTEEAPFVHWRV